MKTFKVALFSNSDPDFNSDEHIEKYDQKMIRKGFTPSPPKSGKYIFSDFEEYFKYKSYNIDLIWNLAVEAAFEIGIPNPNVNIEEL